MTIDYPEMLMPGTRVRCNGSTHYYRKIGRIYPENGESYTIRRVYTTGDGHIWFLFEEIVNEEDPSLGRECGFSPSNFDIIEDNEPVEIDVTFTASYLFAVRVCIVGTEPVEDMENVFDD